MLKNITNLADYDPELWLAIKSERHRQEEQIELIASENYVSARVMEAQGSQLTNKYAEGYPKRRYYGGCKYVDIIEQLAIDRAKSLFCADYANVQPHSGSQANFSVFNALLNPGDVILGMGLVHGGHLTHGASVNFSGKLYRSVFYSVNDVGCIDYEELVSLSEIYHPKLIIAGFSAYSGILDWKKFRQIADNIGAYLFVDMAHVAGLVASGIYPNPLPYAHVVTATTHKTLAGPRGGLILASGGEESFYKKLDSSVFPGSQGGPLVHVIAAKAVAFKEAMEPSFRIYQEKVVKNAENMVNVFLLRGFNVVSRLINNHMFVLNLIDKNLTGREAENILGCANIIVNKNCIPNDPCTSFITSGLRIGTPAVTRRGFNADDICQVAEWICDILDHYHDKSVIVSVKRKVLDMCSNYPVYVDNSE